jgi:ABC-type transport system involved in multi-copper enzyme maturation permease subunit
MTAQPLSARRARMRSAPMLWRSMGRVTWLQHRGALIAAALIFAGTGLAIFRNELSLRGVYGQAAAAGCFGSHSGTNCPAMLSSLASHMDGLSWITIVLLSIPVLTGMFIGAPMLARELESGTYRFAWTQEVGRTRWLVGKLVLLGGASVATACVLGILATWYASPLDSAGLASRWQAGQFGVTGLTLAAWTLFATAAGIFLGLLTARVVGAMAATGALVGGLTLLTFLRLQEYLLAFAPGRERAAPIGVGNGPLNTFAPNTGSQGPIGSWVVSGWYAGPGGGRLSNATVSDMQSQLYASASQGAQKDPQQWLAQHHYAYWVSFQSASRFWIFQGVEAAVLLAFTILLAAGTVWLSRRRLT